MKAFQDMEYFPLAEKIVDVICNRTQNYDPTFFRLSTNFYLTTLASMMHCSIRLYTKDIIPINFYAFNLAPSGLGKGHSTKILEEQITHKFKQEYTNTVLPEVADVNLNKVATQKATKSGLDPDYELEQLIEEFNQCGPLLFSFDSGTTPALKQMRQKILLAGAGSLNLIVDEAGSNLLGNSELLTAFLELYDGIIKTKLIKNTKENQRGTVIDGVTPANMLLFGSPAKLLNGSKVEEEFYSMLETGYARRCFFGYNKRQHKTVKKTPKELLAILSNTQFNKQLEQIAVKLSKLATKSNFKKVLTMPEEVSLLLLEYKNQCELDAEQYKEHEEVKKTQLTHRYFNALKLAGAYAYIDGKNHITIDHLYNAIKLTEASGYAFKEILNRPANHERLAKYITDIGKEVTHADIQQDLPMYKGSAHRQELMTLAIAYGYKNNLIIKKTIVDDVELFVGEALQETNTDELIFSYSTDITRGYQNQTAKWDQLHKLAEADGIHWINHHLRGED